MPYRLPSPNSQFWNLKSVLDFEILKHRIWKNLLPPPTPKFRNLKYVLDFEILKPRILKNLLPTPYPPKFRIIKSVLDFESSKKPPPLLWWVGWWDHFHTNYQVTTTLSWIRLRLGWAVTIYLYFIGYLLHLNYRI